MTFNDFEEVISADRLRRYVKACDGNVQKGMALYRYNLSLSSEMLKIVGCFEVALRNKIDKSLEPYFGSDWLRDSCLPGGIFDKPQTQGTLKIISKAYNGLLLKSAYTPSKLLSEMEFGVWKYMYSGPQYAATGQKLLSVFPCKPKSSADNRFVHCHPILNSDCHRKVNS